MATIASTIDFLNAVVWGPPLLILLVLVGVHLTIQTKGLQFQYFFYAHSLVFRKIPQKGKGSISHFQALMTALAATIGIGSITGVATAIQIGGMGALFWMWIAAFLGMATKYGEAILAIKYRVTDPSGEVCGGPMYYIEKGMRCKWLGITFALFGAIAAFGTGNMVQANSVSLGLSNFFHISPLYSGLALVVFVGFALIGGIRSISKVVGVLVPAMAIFYIVGSLCIIAIRLDAVPKAFELIFRSAFHRQAAFGGFAGSTIMMAIQSGISRGIFSSEAGLGSSSIAAAAAKTDTPGRQALVSMCSVFITTGIVCTITGLVIGISGVLGQIGSDGAPLDGSAMALKAFEQTLPYGGLIVVIALIPFAYSTILGWAYYGEKCVEYLLGFRAIKWYRIIYTCLIFPGAVLGLKVVWGFANLMNGLMAFPNLIALFILTKVIAKETESFRCLLKEERFNKKKAGL